MEIEKFNVRDERQLSMLMDFYELTMSQAYFERQKGEVWVAFDMFFRRVPDNGGYVLFAGLEQFLDYLRELRFSYEDIRYLRSLNRFNEDFLNYLTNFKFRGDIYAPREGEVVFPHEPLVIVEAPLIDAQLIETMLLLSINHQSLIATKASRIVRQAELSGADVIDFGARRAHSYDAADYGARAAHIGGVSATATVSAGMKHNMPVSGTMAHSYIQFYGFGQDAEYEAFLDYAKVYPHATSLLIDTFDVLKSGLPNAIRVHKTYLEPRGHYLKSIRLDSGDLAYLSKECRRILDENGMQDTKIVVSNSIDEFTIASLRDQGAKIDHFGVGERLITSSSTPVFGGVYKLAGVMTDGKTYEPRIKISENIEKVTIPGAKRVYRFYSKKTGEMEFDTLFLRDEVVPETGVIQVTDRKNPYKKIMVNIEDYDVKSIHHKIVDKGKIIAPEYTLLEMQMYARESMSKLWESALRITNPHEHYIDLSEELTNLRDEMLSQLSQTVYMVKGVSANTELRKARLI